MKVALATLLVLAAQAVAADPAPRVDALEEAPAMVDPVYVEPRQKVRVITPEGATIKGRMLSADGEAIVIQRGGKEQRISRDSVAVLQVDHGFRTKPVWLYGAIGLGLGALVGAASAEYDQCGSTYDDYHGSSCQASDDQRREGALAGAAVGVATGIVWSLVERESRLREIPLGRLRVGVAPIRKGAAARVSMRF
jgi:hypothetical protein